MDYGGLYWTQLVLQYCSLFFTTDIYHYESISQCKVTEKLQVLYYSFDKVPCSSLLSLAASALHLYSGEI